MTSQAGQNAEALKRPSLPIALYAVVVAWAVVCGVEHAMWQSYCGELPEWTPGAILAGVLAFAATAAAACVRGRKSKSSLPPAVALLAGLALCAAGCAWLCWHAWEDDVCRVERILAEGGARIDVTGDPTIKDYGTVSTASTRIGSHEAALRVLWPDGSEAPPAGYRVLVNGTCVAPEHDDAGRWSHRNGYVGLVRVATWELEGCSGSLRGWVAPFRERAFSAMAGLGGDAAALLPGVVLGNRTRYVGTELEQCFRSTGLAHLMAVSGTHLAVVAALLSWAARRFRLPRAPSVAATGVLLVAYTALTGFSPSASRACAMCLVALGARLFLRRGHVLSALSLCAFAFLGLSPPLAFSLGFQLSVLAVFGLTLFAPLVAAWLRALVPGKLKALGEPAGATLAATMPTLPVTIATFVQFPLVSPLSTLAAAPLLSVSVALGLCGSCLVPALPAAGGFVLSLAAVPMAVCAYLVRLLAQLPFACLPLDAAAEQLSVACAAGIVLLWAVWPVPSRALGAAEKGRALVVFCAPAVLAVAWGFGTASQAPVPFAPASAQVVMLDVGQGDAMLVRDGRAAMLVDTGEDGAVLKRCLARNGVAHLDAVVLTHKDLDHTGALSALEGVVGVDHVYVHEDLLSYAGEHAVLESARRVTAGRGAEGVAPGDKMRAGSFTMTVLSPARGGDSENEDSLVHLLEYDADADGVPETRGLLTGDAEHEVLGGAVATCGDVDFVKVGHHGSKGAFSDEQLAVLSPQFALIGVGAGNDYGHPARETLDMLARAGAKVYRTDLHGDIVVAFSERRMGVAVQKGDVGQQY